MWICVNCFLWFGVTSGWHRKLSRNGFFKIIVILRGILFKFKGLHMNLCDVKLTKKSAFSDISQVSQLALFFLSLSSRDHIKCKWLRNTVFMEQKQLSEDLDNVWYIFFFMSLSQIFHVAFSFYKFCTCEISETKSEQSTLMDYSHLIDDVYFANVISGSRFSAVFLWQF